MLYKRVSKSAIHFAMYVGSSNIVLNGNESNLIFSDFDTRLNHHANIIR